MSDDLVKRLRLNRSTLQMWLGEHLLEQYEKERTEAADRIEKLEADLETATMKRLLDSDRIEKLEAALREIANGQRDADKSYAELLAEVRIEARKALEGEIMESETGPSPKLNVEYYAILYWQERYEKSKKRIEKLEAALREIAEVDGVKAGPEKDMYRRWRYVATNAIDIARKALEGKDG